MSNLITHWREAAADLGLEIVVPYQLVVRQNVRLNAALLIKNFGYSNGMLVFTNYDEIAPYVDEITRLGFGSTVLSEPPDKEKYTRDVYIEILSDWTWSGSGKEKPSWVID